MMMIDCRQAVARMWAYLARDLDRHDSDELEQHLDACQRCCGELEFSRELRRTVAQSGVQRMPNELRARVEQLLDERPPADRQEGPTT
jgi:mycothiol system anti-sigma-R factor